MFEPFKRRFPADPYRVSDIEPAAVAVDPSVRALLTELGGCSFASALFRVARLEDLDAWAARITTAFPDFAGRATCFGFDWLGRAFAADSARSEKGRPAVLMLDPATDQVLRIPADIEDFLDRELLDFGEEALEVSLHRAWLDADGAVPAYDQCIGFKRPLFLGGGDALADLEVSDLDVYWHIFGQLLTRTRNLPLGTPVRVRMEPDRSGG
jgi:hypothetical protein